MTKPTKQKVSEDRDDIIHLKALVNGKVRELEEITNDQLDLCIEATKELLEKLIVEKSERVYLPDKDDKIKKFEIINPSDKAFLEAESFKVACIATIFFSDGLYGLKAVDDEDKTMPPTRFATGWFLDTFKQTEEQALKEVDKVQLKQALLSVKLNAVRSSLNDIEGRTKEFAKMIKI